jgi:simple sugar transport system permease protein
MVVLEMSAFAAIISCLIMGALVGLVNGLLIVKARVPDLLATLGMMFLLIGLQRIPTEGRSISTGMKLPSGETTEGVYSQSFLWLGRHRLDFFLRKSNSNPSHNLYISRNFYLAVPRVYKAWKAYVCNRLK